MGKTPDPDGSSTQRNALDFIERTHRLQLLLCDMLEQIADGLPQDVDRRLCQRAMDVLRNDIPLHHLDEERGLFPLIERKAIPTDNMGRILATLTQEHKTDEAYSAELIENLETLSEGRQLGNPNMVGYMLRGFFESYRRHIQWEDAVILPLARARLTKADLDDLERTMAHHRTPGSW